MKKIIASIVTYNPDIEILNKNIKSFYDEVSKIIIIDNNSINIDEILHLQNDKIQVISNNINVGIAKALNTALEFAYEDNFDYLLTMDQDSYFDSNGCSLLLDGFVNDKISIVCPSLLDVNSKSLDSVSESYQKIFTTITSGSLCLVKAFIDVGGFKDELFIDYVDFEICLRLQRKGYLILKSRDCILNHQLGDSKVFCFFGFRFISTNHSPLRRYYYARNKVYIYKKYSFRFLHFVLMDLLSFIKTIFIIIALENDKFKKLKMIAKGSFHGLFKI